MSHREINLYDGTHCTWTWSRSRWVMSSWKCYIFLLNANYKKGVHKCYMKDFVTWFFLWCQVLTVKVPKSNLLKLFFMVIHKKSRNLYSLFYIWNFLKLKSGHPFNPQISKIVLWSNRIWIMSGSDVCLVTTQDLL